MRRSGGIGCHLACPLLGGTKWGANIWIWNRQRYGEIRTGEARTVLMENMCDEDVYVSWEGQASSVIQGHIMSGR